MAIVIDPNESRDRRIKMLLDTATSAMQIQNQKREIQLKEQELDPRVQAGKMANMMALMGNTDGAAQMFEYAKSGNLPTGGSQLPSQSVPTIIPDYLTGGQNRINSQSAGLSPNVLSPSSSMGVMGGTMRVGGNSIRLGQPGMSEIDKANLDIHKGVVSKGLEAQQKTSQGAEQTASSLGLYLDQYKRSYEELKKFDPGIDKEGTSAWFSRRGGDIANYFDNLPETAALKSMAAPFAQEVATMIEGRATDQDRDIQRKAFADVLQGPSTKNIRLASNSLINLYRKGAKIDKVLNTLESSDVDIMNKIAKEVYKSHPELKPVNDTSKGLDDIFKGL